MEGATPAPCPPWEPPLHQAGGHREEGQREGQGAPAPPSQAGRVGVHACSPGLLPSPEEEEEWEAFSSLNTWGVQQGLAPPAQPHKEKGELLWHLGTRVGVQSKVYVCMNVYVCTRVCVPVCASIRVCLCCVRVLVAVFGLHRFVYACEFSCARIWVCPTHTRVCKHVCVHAFVCAHAPPPCVSLSVHTPESV